MYCLGSLVITIILRTCYVGGVGRFEL